MQQVIVLSELLRVAKVSELTIDSLPKILQAITDNKIKLNGQALDAVTSLLKSAPSAVTAAYDTIQNATQKANSHNDKLSLEYIKELLSVFKSSGVTDKRIAKLLKQIEDHEHEIRLVRTKGNYSFGKMALGIVGFIAAIVVHNKTQKRNFWEK
ncbi:MAG: hypothetical protein WCK96_11635 [Methylococcales bacterium]